MNAHWSIKPQLLMGAVTLMAFSAFGLNAAAHAASPSFKFTVAPHGDIQDVLSVLAPVNLRQLDRLSKPIFDDFFTQKDRVYRQDARRTPPTVSYRKPPVNKPLKASPPERPAGR